MPGFAHAASTPGTRPAYATRPQDIPILLYLYSTFVSIPFIRPSRRLSHSVLDLAFYLFFGAYAKVTKGV